MAFKRLKFDRLWTVDDETEEKGFRTHQDSETRVREDLQYHPDAILAFLNSVLLPALESKDACESIGVEMEGTTAATLSEALSYIVGEFMRVDGRVDDVATGMLPGDMLAKKINFAETAWTPANGVYTLSVDYANHTRVNDTFGYRLWCNTANGPVSDCWAVQGTSVVYINGTVILTAEEPYSGHIVFTGVATEVAGE